MYRDRYLREPQLDATDLVVEACKKAAIAPSRAALRWMVHHSALRDGDGLILGASKLAHFDDNLAAVAEGPLPDDVLAAFDEAWELVKAHACCPSYERGTSLYAPPS
mmetsp:Transcript_563/g.2205  ORF Transcript_563/g.2205 Transcript_563/m.2205 type:complete len:107 (-) Transcript_563:281-601(-)